VAQFPNVADLSSRMLANAITAVQTSFAVEPDFVGAPDFPSAPFIATLGFPGLDGAYRDGRELILVEGKTGDAWSSITRSFGGTTAPAEGWPAETPVRLCFNAMLFNLLKAAIVSGGSEYGISPVYSIAAATGITSGMLASETILVAG